MGEFLIKPKAGNDSAGLEEPRKGTESLNSSKANYRKVAVE